MKRQNENKSPLSSRPKKGLLALLAVGLFCLPVTVLGSNGNKSKAAVEDDDGFERGGIEERARQDAVRIRADIPKTVEAQNIAQDPNATPQQRDAARRFVEQKQKNVQGAMDRHPQSSEVAAAASEFSLKTGNSRQARERAERAVALAKTPEESVGALEARAAAKAALGDRAGALSDAEAGLKINPRSEKLLTIKKLLGGRGQGGGAGPVKPPPAAGAAPWPAPRPATPAEWQRNMKGTPLYDAVARSQQSLAAKDFAGALAFADQAVRLDARDIMALFQRGQVHMAMKRYDLASEDLAMAVAQGMVWGALNKLLSKAYLKQGRYKPALDWAEEAVKTSPDDPEAYAARAAAKIALTRPAHELDVDLAALEKAGGFSGEIAEIRRYQAGWQPSVPPGPGQAAGLPERRPDIIGPVGGRTWGEQLGKRWRALSAQGKLAAVGAALVLAGLLGWLWSLVKSAWSGHKAAPFLPPPTPAGTILADRYEVVEREIAQGGMGTIDKGLDRRLGRYVAIKTIRPDKKDDPGHQKLFRNEKEVLSALDHENILAILDGFQQDGRYYIVTKLVQGVTVWDLVQAKGFLELKQAGSVLRQACSALDYAHERRVLHRDLKPNNMMLEAERLVILDFGIAKIVEELGTPAGLATIGAGTPAFAAPEVMEGRYSRESDLYSLGASLYYMLTGKLPFGLGGDQAKKLSADFEAAAKLRQALPAAVDSFFKTAMAASPRDRFHTGKELHEAFRKAIDGPA